MDQKIMEIVRELNYEFLQNDILNKIENFSKLNKFAETGQVVFLGDSITEGFPIEEMLKSSKILYKRGISGIRSDTVLEHFDEIMGGLKAGEVFILLGTNDLAHNRSTDSIVETLTNICDRLKLENHATEIHIISIYPIIEGYTDMVDIRQNKDIITINSQLEVLAETDSKVHYYDIYPLLLDDKGQLEKNYTKDGLHLTIEGYQKVCEVLQEALV